MSKPLGPKYGPWLVNMPTTRVLALGQRAVPAQGPTTEESELWGLMRVTHTFSES